MNPSGPNPPPESLDGAELALTRKEYDLLESRREEIDAHYRVLSPVPL